LQAGNAVSFFGYGLILPFEIIYLHQIRGFATATAGLVLAAILGTATLGYEWCRQAPELVACYSVEVLPEIREYERTSTTVINAYVMPIVRRYLATLRAGLDDDMFEPPPVESSDITRPGPWG